jgi:hypothetical protein
VLDRKFISAAIWILGAILGPLVLTSALQGNPIPLLALGGAIFLFLIIFVMKERAIALPVIGLFMGGRLNFLPFGLDLVAVLSLALIAYYFFAYFTMKQRNLTTGPYCLFIPIGVITAIVLFHTRKLGLYQLTGSAEEGSRPGLMMLLGAVTYFCGISIAPPPRKFLARLPYYCLVLSVLAAIPGMVTTFYPAIAPYLYYITDSVNVDAYKEANGYVTDIARNRAFASVGESLALFLLCWYPMYTWWRPNRWWVPLLLVIGFGLVVFGGFRSDVASFCILVMLAMWCYFSWRSLFVLPIVLAGTYALSFCVSGGLVPLPTVAQRSLSFLPGKWDPEATASANASVDFRNNIQTVYMREEMYKSPFIGNGFTFDRAKYQKYLDLAQTSETPDNYYQSKAFITARMYHIGWISVYDTIGLIGGIAFLAMLLAMLCIATYFILGRVDPHDLFSRLKIWLFCNIWVQAIGFFTIFGDVRNTFTTLCAYALVLVHLCWMDLGWGKKVEVSAPRKQEGIGSMGKADPAPSLLQS